MNKKDLRITIKNIASSLSEDYKKISGRLIAEKIISSAEFKNSDTIFIYISTRNEPQTSEIISYALLHGKTVCVPKCIDKGIMKAIKLNSPDELDTGKYGIAEPTGKEEISPDSIDLSVIPCISASRDGKRLGHGGGYYDRFLQNCPAAKVCLCFDSLICDEIPMDSFDVYMDKVITEQS